MGAGPASERGADEEMGLEFDYDSQPIEFTHGSVSAGRNFGSFLSLFSCPGQLNR